MKIGLLETDVLYDDLIPDYGSYGQMFERFFSSMDTSLTFHYYQIQQGEFPADFSECDIYLITGSKAGVYETHDWLPPLINWVQQAYKAGSRLLGICFGHQLLAQALGGNVEKSEKGWGMGVRELPVLPSDSSTMLPGDHLRLIYSHQDQVQTLPDSAECILGDDFCPFAAFRINNQVLAFQGHPEFDEAYTRRLLSRRADVIGEPVFSRGMDSLNSETDSAATGQWILNFFREKSL